MRMTVWPSKAVISSRKLFLRKTIFREIAISHDAEDFFFFCMPLFVFQIFAGLEMFCGGASV